MENDKHDRSSAFGGRGGVNLFCEIVIDFWFEAVFALYQQQNKKVQLDENV